MGKYHEYYDRLNLHKKDYRGDVQKIAQICKEFSWKHDKILEIGCGTGNHTEHLCRMSDTVVACDTDPAMLSIAKSKLDDKITFYNDVADVVEREFTLGVMMWNVLNYIPTMKMMKHVFSEVRTRLCHGGLFIFDMWNGVAVLRDLPRTAKNEIKYDGANIIHHLEGDTSLMDLKTTILNKIWSYHNGRLVDHFSHNVYHYIWTANIVAEILSDAGLSIVRIAKTEDFKTPATEEDWKLVFVARK